MVVNFLLVAISWNSGTTFIATLFIRLYSSMASIRSPPIGEDKTEPRIFATPSALAPAGSPASELGSVELEPRIFAAPFASSSVTFSDK